MTRKKKANRKKIIRILIVPKLASPSHSFSGARSKGRKEFYRMKLVPELVEGKKKEFSNFSHVYFHTVKGVEINVGKIDLICAFPFDKLRDQLHLFRTCF